MLQYILYLLHGFNFVYEYLDQFVANWLGSVGVLSVDYQQAYLNDGGSLDIFLYKVWLYKVFYTPLLLAIVYIICFILYKIYLYNHAFISLVFRYFLMYINVVYVLFAKFIGLVASLIYGTYTSFVEFIGLFIDLIYNTYTLFVEFIGLFTSLFNSTRSGVFLDILRSVLIVCFLVLIFLLIMKFYFIVIILLLAHVYVRLRQNRY